MKRGQKEGSRKASLDFEKPEWWDLLAGQVPVFISEDGKILLIYVRGEWTQFNFAPEHAIPEERCGTCGHISFPGNPAWRNANQPDHDLVKGMRWRQVRGEKNIEYGDMRYSRVREFNAALRNSF